MTSRAIDRRSLPYAAFWCEENVWQLCEHELVAGLERYVMIVSSRSGRVAMWRQRAAGARQVIAWDYHVVLLVREPARGWLIWDLDTTLELPVAAERWLDASFLPLRPEFHALEPCFRVIPAADYRSLFSSDRSHMLDEAGVLRTAAPSWPPILRGEPNLMRMIDMHEPWLGRLLSLPELQAWLASSG